MPSLDGVRTNAMGAIGELTAAGMAKGMGTEMVNTIRVFQSYFGPYPYKQLAVTNIPYSYGQGWPGLIYLSAISFMDSTQRHTLGFKDQDWLTDFWRAHESSHQWWGHRVGWKSYHDQWLSEGFAEFSGILYTQYRDNMKEYLRLLRDNKTMLETSDIHGHHYEQVGPIWMGLRLASSVSPGAYNEVIYKKGGYVLHMLRMMLYDFRNPDHDHLFKDMMKDFCQTYDTKSASTEDFQAIVEKHMSRAMDLDSNHKMDWFFNQYVYGTGIPQYNFHYSATATPDGKFKISGMVTRSGVSENWKDMVPLYLHQGQGVMRAGFVNATMASTPFEFIMQNRPDKLTVNDFEDVLADVKQ
jgi:aminopeptidase N